MQRALWLDNVSDLLGLPLPWPERLYLGRESCEHALPSPEELSRGLDACARNGASLTLVTPPCSPAALSRVTHLLVLLPPASEVVFNDWGLVEAIRKSGHLPVHGRLLNRAVRDPRIEPGRHSEAALGHLRGTTIHTPEYQALLREEGVVRVELDNLRQGLLPLSPGSLPASLVHPFVHISTSRYCAGRFAARCPGRPCPARHSQVEGAPLFLWGTASYELRTEMPSDLPGLGVDRVVEQLGPEGAAGVAEPWEDFHRARDDRSACCSGEDVVELPEELMARIHSVFEIGFGAGRYLAHFAAHGKTVAGIDLSRSAVARARAHLSGADLREGDFLSAALPSPQDCVVDIGCFHAVPPSLRALYTARVKSLVANEGLYLVAAFEGSSHAPVFRVGGRIDEWAFAPGEMDAWLAPELRLLQARHEPASPAHPPIRFAVYERRGGGAAAGASPRSPSADSPRPSGNRFFRRLAARCEILPAPLCVRFAAEGDPGDLAGRGVALVEAHAAQAAAFWPDRESFEAYGEAGRAALRTIIAAVPDGTGVLLSASTGGAPSSVEQHARRLFDDYGAGAIVLARPPGADELRAFLAHEGRGLFVAWPMADELAPLAGEPVALFLPAPERSRLSVASAEAPARWILVDAAGAATDALLSPGTGDRLLLSLPADELDRSARPPVR